MINKADVKVTNKYAFTLDISVDEFFDEPWSNLGKRVTFVIKADESMEMFEKHSDVWKWKIPKKAANQLAEKKKTLKLPPRRFAASKI